LVFEKIVDIICFQAKHGLLVFLLENVRGILQRCNNQPPYIETLLRRLDDVAPWMDVQVRHSNSMDHAVPHSRPRVYIMGIHKQLLVARPGCESPPTPLPRVSLYDFMEKNLPVTSSADWSPKMWSNIVDKYVPILTENGFFSDVAFQHKCAVIDCSRDPDKKWGSTLRIDDLAGTLTTGNLDMCVFSGGEGFDLDALEVKPQVFRRFTKEERLRLQALESHITSDMTARESCAASGNAYTCSAIGRHLAGAVSAMTTEAGLLLVHALISRPAGVRASPHMSLDQWIRRTPMPRANCTLAADVELVSPQAQRDDAELAARPESRRGSECMASDTDTDDEPIINLLPRPESCRDGVNVAAIAPSVDEFVGDMADVIESIVGSDVPMVSIGKPIAAELSSAVAPLNGHVRVICKYKGPLTCPQCNVQVARANVARHQKSTSCKTRARRNSQRATIAGA
jgi:hypothetical protein